MEKKKEKEEKERKEREREFSLLLNQEEPSTEEDPQIKLNGGIIPEDFKRQMFYTLADYKDILFSGSKDDNTKSSTYNDIINGDKDIAEREKQIKGAIQTFFQNGDKNPVQTTTKPEDWWNEHAPSIWHGMICALTYDTDSGEKGGKPKKIQEVYEKIFGKDDKPIPGTPGTFESKYEYSKVELKEEDDSGEKRPDSSPPSGEKTTLNNPKLTEFVEIPPFFRWLHEWGSDFCDKRARMLKNVKKACREKHDGNPTYCSGDGHDCTDNDRKYNKMFADFHCPGCAKECMKYKTWIYKKFAEFQKQKDKYKEEHDKLKANHNGDNNCCKEIHNRSTAADFLKSLKHCSNDQNSGEKGTEDEKNKINFKEPLQTFSRSTYCKACPLYGVKEKGGIYEPIIKNHLTGENDNNATDINVHVLGLKGEVRNNDEELKELKEVCNNAGFVEDYSLQKWNCQKKKDGIDQCKLTNSVDNIDDSDKIIPFNVFFQRWLRNFVHDYNKLKHIIHPCIKKGNGKEDKCIKDCNNKCECVGNWLKKKEKEWGNIKKHYEKHSNDDNETIAYRIKSYFEQLYFDSDYKKAQDVVEGEEEQKKLWGCTGHDECSEKEKEENKNFITNLISELQKKIKTCPTQPGGKTETQCEDPPLVEEETDPLDDDTSDEPLDDYYIQQPKICPPPLTCVEEIAKQLREEAEGKVKTYDTSLLGDGTKYKSDCNKVKKLKGATGEGSCEFEKTYKNSLNKLNNQCERKGMNRLKIEQEWNCKYIKDIGKHLCIPPRREHMCINHLKQIIKYTDTDSTTLLKKVQEAAQHEGDDIIKKLLPKNTCNENVICDAMKYSFADLADIIRGRDLLRKDPDQVRIQKRLQSAFENIYNTLNNNNQNKYKGENPYYYKLRSDWWDANRRHIWKAMTCNAPDEAYLFKKGIRLQKNIKYCGHDEDPPYDDYIPQILRWMTEWSECYCRMLHKKIDDMKVYCDDCKWSSTNCSDDNEGTKCLKCKELCKQYTSLIKKWKPQFDIQEKIYKDLYMNTLTKKILKTTDNDYVKAFLDKLRVKHNRRSCMANNLGTYLRMTSQCEDVLFPERDSDKNKHEYAFNDYPDKYINQCVCKITNHPLDKCPFTNENKSSCDIMKEFSECKNKTFNNKLDNWGTHDLKHRTTINQGVLVPPRRTRLCLKPFIKNKYAENKEDIFFKDFITAAYTEAYVLRETFKNEPTETLQAMKYSFADYGDIIKGTDMIDNIYLNNLKTQLETILKYNGRTSNTKSTKDWWDNNKNKVWNAMLCGYQKGKNNTHSEKLDEAWCDLPMEGDIPQFLRWFQEWTESFCTRRKKLYKEVENACKTATCTSEDGTIRPEICKKNCEKYRNYISRKKQEYEFLNYQYKKTKLEDKEQGENASNYFKTKCNGKCECLSGKFIQNSTLENPYDTIEDDILKGKCDCIKIRPPPKKKEPKSNDQDEDQSSKPVPIPVKPPEESLKKPDDVLPPPAREPFDSTILQTTIPFGIALALGSIAFLFLK
ncbi:hypothetical protein PFMC_05276, partial [Plasmodium falciparum CAMP/Malaysia]